MFTGFEFELHSCGCSSVSSLFVILSEFAPSTVSSWFIADTPGFEERENRFQFVGNKKFLKDLRQKQIWKYYFPLYGIKWQIGTQ